MDREVDAYEVEAGALADMVSAAASHWDGAEEHEWALGRDVLDQQVEFIYDVQKQSWHEGLFEPDVVKHWIELSIRERALSLREYLRDISQREREARV